MNDEIGNFISNTPRPGHPEDVAKHVLLKRKVNVLTMSPTPDAGEPEILREIKSMTPAALADRLQTDPVFARRCAKYRP